MRRRATTTWLAAAMVAAGAAACALQRDELPPSSGVHPAGITDPSSPAFHGALLRARRWAPMLDAADGDACGRCHAGAPATPAGVTSSAPGATACTECHAPPAGPLGCGTCHAAQPTTGAHAAHLAPSAARGTALACSSCHPTPGPGVIGGTHGNGSVEIVFDPGIVGPEASFDLRTGVCAVSCHDQGGLRARPAWSEQGGMTCGSCHEAPPAGHPPGACTSCHREANADGTALSATVLHMNGRVDLGDGSGTCGACHGAGGDPWPRTGAHAAHESPALTSPIACASCHPVPPAVSAPGHLDGAVQVVFGGRALDRGARPAWDGERCASVACHGAGLVEAPSVVPAWADASGAASACGACHGAPPMQHTPSTSCERAGCHGGEVARGANGELGISAAGRALHVDGVVESGTP